MIRALCPVVPPPKTRMSPVGGESGVLRRIRMFPSAHATPSLNMLIRLLVIMQWEALTQYSSCPTRMEK